MKKVHVNVGTIGHIDHGKTTLTAAILAVQAQKGLARIKSYQDIARGGTVRDETKTVTIITSHVEYETAHPALRPHRLPRPRRLRQEHDHRGGADGRCHPAALGGGRPDAADPGAHPARPAGRRPRARRVPQQVRSRGRPGLDRSGRTGDPRSADEVRLRWSYGPVRPWQRPGALDNPGDPEAARCIDELLDALDAHIPEPKRASTSRSSCPSKVFTPSRAAARWRPARSSRGVISVGQKVEILGLGDVLESVCTSVEAFKRPLTEGEAGKNVGCPAARHQGGPDPARPGDRRSAHDPASVEVPGRGLRPEQGRRRPAHAVLQRLQAAVLLPDHRTSPAK